MNQRVLCLLVDGFEEIETITPVDILRRAGAEVTTAAIGSFHVTGRSGITIHADGVLTDVATEEFEMLLIPGGPGVAALRTDGRAATLARQFYDQGKLVAAICAAPVILQDAGILAGKTFTAHTAVHGELPGVSPELRVVKSGNVITSRGAGTALEFALELVSSLFGEEKKQQIADSILA